MDTIAITFPQVKVKIPIEGLAFDNLEDMIFEISQNIACRVLKVKQNSRVKARLFSIVVKQKN